MNGRRARERRRSGENGGAPRDENGTQYKPGDEWEPSAWMRDLLARCQDRANVLVPVGATSRTTLLMYASEPGIEGREAWERTCDHCGRHVAPTPPSAPAEFFIAGIDLARIDGLVMRVAVGLCERCAVAEGWDTEAVS